MLGLKLLEGGFDEVFDARVRIVFEEGGHDFGDGGLGEAKHYQGRCGLIDQGVVVALENGAVVSAGALDDLVLELQNEPLGTLEADSLDTFDAGNVLGKDGLADFFGG